MPKSFFSEVISDFISLIYPQLCCGCNISLIKGEEHLCTKCLLELPKINPGLEVGLSEKFLGRVPFSYAQAFLKFRKRGLTQKLLHQLKYGDQPDLGVKLGRLFGHSCKNEVKNYDFLVPVPLHADRYKQRGYNQSECIAEGLSLILNIPVANVLKRGALRESQTKRSKLKRWNNVRDAFSLTEDIKDKKIILVDDVVTTGATMEACTEVLLTGKPDSVGLMSLALA